jgi:hypothetical protein
MGLSATIAMTGDSRDEPKAVHKKCLEWAAWARCARPGAVSNSEGYMRERIDPAHAGEPTPEIALMDKAVAQMYVERQDYKRVFDRYYLNPTALSEEEIADELGLKPQLVNAMLRQARILVAFRLHQLKRTK